MSLLLSSKDGVKARKPHRCWLCGEPINTGDLHDTRTGISDGVQTMRMHPECHAYESRETVDPDWYEDVSEPAFDRNDALAAQQNHEPTTK